MKFQDLHLDLRLYRAKEGQQINDSAESLSYNNAQTGSTGVSSTIIQPAVAVAPGTQIFSAVWSTSTSGNRITLTPNDVLTVYESGLIQMRLTNQGITFGKTGLRFYDTGSAVVVTSPSSLVYSAYGTGLVETDTGVLPGTGLFMNNAIGAGIMLDGVALANYYRGFITSSGTKLLGTGGYTSARTGTGRYVITFTNPALAITPASFSCVATASSGFFVCQITYPALNQIRFDWVDITGVASDTNFNFVASRATI